MEEKLLAPASLYKLLEKTGLSDKEIGVYLTVLHLKSARASSIAKKSGQSRSHTYLLLESLIEKGLVSESEENKILHFVAEPPERLIQYTKNREQSLKQTGMLLADAMPLLRSIEGPLTGQPRITTFTGPEGMKQVLRDMLLQEFCGVFNPDYSHQFFGTNVVTSMLGDKPCLTGRDLLVDSPQTKIYLEEVPVSNDYQVRLLPSFIAPTSDMLIAGDMVALIAYDKDSTTIRIENQNLADSFRMWFEGLWSISKEASTPCST